MSPKVLVTGATGFIGQHLVRRLAAEGLAVRAMSRRGGMIGAVPVEALDLRDESEVPRLTGAGGYDAIVHLAAAIPAEADGPTARKAFFDNIAATMNVLQAACEHGAYLVYASSTSVYGSRDRGDLPLNEESLPRPDSYYASSKLTGEVLCQQLARTRGLSCAVLRISAPYGQGCGRPTVVNAFLRAAIAGRDLTVYGSGRRTQDFIYIADVVEAIVVAMRKRAAGVFNIAAGAPVSMAELARLVVTAAEGSASRIVLGSEADPQEGYRASFSTDRARRELAWLPQVPLPQGLKLTAEALRRE